MVYVDTSVLVAMCTQEGETQNSRRLAVVHRMYSRIDFSRMVCH